MGTFPNTATQFKPGQSGNPAGKPKGALHITTWIQNLLNDEEFEANILDSKVGVWQFKGAPLEAIIRVAIQRAVGGDKRWADWLAENGYGRKLDVTSGGESLAPLLVKFVGEDKKQD